ncbi:ABC-three component system middle component 8 [Sinomicrobium soli]|uniref:ABC-three component system middle component 8 n=1 Tax=Sinomicrobium sp. N-1-3-6 TaxID=2219864 RepID=UPI000DCC48F1|nr:hypothetical protein DN748_15175 [Sinomicrobium sp. N-1-3-6]
MIRPDRHTNPEFSVLNISSIILSELNTFYPIQYDTLLKKVTEVLGEEAKINFPYALNFLFLLGKLNYEQSTDSFKSNEA